MKILLGYSHYKVPPNGTDVKLWVEAWANRLKQHGIDVTPFCLTINPPNSRLDWEELDKKWRNGDKKLLKMYFDLLTVCKKYDVFINWNGINLHPDFVEKLPILKVYSCFDDPESSEIVSKPVAKAYDLCLVGNIAEVDTYWKWGVKKAEFWPLGYFETDCEQSITEEQILSDERDVDLALLCERKSLWRQERLEKFSEAFPDGAYYGEGWGNGFLDEDKKISLYKSTKIGPNFHNSTGPINFRTFMLPANGVMLLCDNKKHLSKLYKLGVEAVGFDSVEEAIEKCKYYLENDDERKRIAVAGWKRAKKDYNEVASFGVGLKHIESLVPKKFSDDDFRDALLFLNKQYDVSALRYGLYIFKSCSLKMYQLGIRALKKICRILHINNFNN